jgi:hypothetical protein
MHTDIKIPLRSRLHRTYCESIIDMQVRLRCKSPERQTACKLFCAHYDIYV